MKLFNGSCWAFPGSLWLLLAPTGASALALLLARPGYSTLLPTPRSFSLFFLVPPPCCRLLLMTPGSSRPLPLPGSSCLSWFLLGTRRIQETPKAARRNQEEEGGAKRSQEGSGRLSRNRKKPGGARRAEPGGTRGRHQATGARQS